MRRLLEVLDDFELALAARGRGCRPDRLLKGVELVYAKLLDALRPRGSSGSRPRAQPFDPELHEALMQTGEGDGEPHVAEVFRAGLHAARPGDPARRRARRAGVTPGRGRAPRRSVASGSRRTTTPSSACPRTRARPRSRRPTASSPSSTTPTRTPATLRAEERFKEISAAYDVIGDEEKRASYDRAREMGAGGFGGGFPDAAAPAAASADIRAASGSTTADVNLERPARRHVRRLGRGGAARPSRGADLETEVTLSFDDAMAGVTVPVTLTGPAPCTTCHGSGAAPGHPPGDLPDVRRLRPGRGEPGASSRWRRRARSAGAPGG